MFSLGVFACDPGIVVEGTVVDAKDEPIDDARVTVDCKHRSDTFKGEGRSDRHGEFYLDMGLGCLPNSCKVKVTADGKSKSFNVSKHCETRVSQCEDACNVVRIEAQLK